MIPSNIIGSREDHRSYYSYLSVGPESLESSHVIARKKLRGRYDL
jgi:hypothetical protein